MANKSRFLSAEINLADVFKTKEKESNDMWTNNPLLEDTINRLNAMQNTPKNANHEWLLGWFTPTNKTINSNKVSIKEMLHAWARVRTYCKRNNLEIQGFRRITIGEKYFNPTLEIGILASRESLEKISESLSQKFSDSGFRSTIMKPLPTSTTIQYIERYFSKSHIAGIRPISFLNHPQFS